MIPNFLSAPSGAIASALANHLWQSTIIAAAAGLLALFLRRHHARARYWLWLAASVKFLIPFSWLVGIGGRLAWLRASAPQPSGGFYFVMEQMTQPFTPSAPPVSSAMVYSAPSASVLPLLPIFAALWLCGFLAVLLLWIVRWRRISSAIRAAVPLCEGREVEALRRVERREGLRLRIPLLSSRSSMEPGIFGIARPVLVWPDGISRHLEDAHLEAIVAHEVLHVRRRDNLSAALHMIVEAVFWFYPLVWWLGSRLVEERERACDEEVVEYGSDRQVYAESILKVCEFCLGSPLACVSGVTGADLKRRMVHIMSDRMLQKLDFARKSLLAVVAVAAIAAPIMFGLLHATPGQAQSQDVTMASASASFDRVSIKPDMSADGPNTMKMMLSLDDGGFTAQGVSLQSLIKLAYHVQDSQLSGGPDWLNTQKYDIDAKLNSAAAQELRKAGPNHHGPNNVALQSLLRDYFKLAAHTESRNQQVYDLVVDNDGPKFKESNGLHLMNMLNGELTTQGTPLMLLVDQLSMRLGRAVVDKTGLKGQYAFNLRWTPDADEEARLKAGGLRQGPPASAPQPSGPPLLTAVQEQLGLRLEPRNDSVPVLVIDHAEMPAEN
jgi:bla regulator protein blaR1